MKYREIMESIHTVPTSNDDFERLGSLMEKPLPAAMARTIIIDIIDDDDLNAQLEALEEKDIKADSRQLIIQWVKNNMPDMLAPPTNDGINSPLGNESFDN